MSPDHGPLLTEEAAKRFAWVKSPWTTHAVTFVLGLLLGGLLF
jgi:hypothetical protein